MKPRILAAALAALMVLPLAGCGSSSPSGSSSQSPTFTRTALNQPVYPDFPQQPDYEEFQDDWEAYDKASTEYYEQLSALRGDGISPDTVQALSDFAGRSTALAIEGMEGENTIYSPLSLWSALAMLAQCAGGESRQQVLSALGGDGLETLQEQVAQVWQGLYTDDGVSSLLLANSIWLNSSMEGSYVEETLETLARDYYAGAFSVPMGTSEADQAVTDWVSEQTHGLIGGEEPVVETKEYTVALLASSLYYKAPWAEEFSESQTWADTFTDAAGNSSQVDFMHQQHSGTMLTGEGWQAASLSTRLGEVVFVLPDEGVTPESLLEDGSLLSSLDFNNPSAQSGAIEWSVPKFDVSSELDLLPALEQLGITDLLDSEAADLSPLTSIGAYLSGATQMARVKADEEGVEAAAVTILTMDATAALEDPEPMVMDLDHPFLFVIRTEGVPLFVGIVNQVNG